MVYQLSQQVSKTCSFGWVSRAQGASILYQKVAREPYQKKVWFVFRKETHWVSFYVGVRYSILLNHFCHTQQHKMIYAVCTLAQVHFERPKNSSNGLENMQQKIFQCRKPQVSLAAARWPLGTSERIWRSSTSQQGRKTRPAPFQSVWFFRISMISGLIQMSFSPKNRTAKIQCF